MHSKRGCDGINAAGVLPGFEGTAVHDGWAPYRLYEKARHALCGAHNLRELLGAEEQGQSWAAAVSALLLDTKEAVDRARAAEEDRLSDRALAGLGDCIALGYEQNPGLQPDQGGRRPKRTTCCCSSINANRRHCASRTTSGSRLTTTCASGICGW